MRRSRLFISTLVLFLVVPMAIALPAPAQTNASPVASFSAWRVDEDQPATVHFDATASRDSDGSITAAQWLFGDGTTGSGLIRDHEYARAGQYSVTLLVTDNQGSTALVVQTVDVAALPIGASQATPAAVMSSAPVGIDVGFRAPDISLPNAQGKIVNLSDFLGHEVLVEFWRSTCSACRSATPYLDSLAKQYEDQGLVIFLVVLDANFSDALTYLANNGYTHFVPVYEGNTGERPASTTYEVSSLPHVVLVDPTEVIRFSGRPTDLTVDLLDAWL